jgi:hypothetical protein
LLCCQTFILQYLTYFPVYLQHILFAGYELSRSQPAAGESDSDNFKPYSDILSENPEFSGTTKSEQCNKRMPREAEYANNAHEGYSHAVLFVANVPKQDSYSYAGSQQHNVNLPQSKVKSETVHIPIPVVTKQDNLEASVLPVKDVKPTKLKLQKEQRVCFKFKKTGMVWIC